MQSRPLSLTHCQSLSAHWLHSAARLAPLCNVSLCCLSSSGQGAGPARPGFPRGVPGWRLVNMTGESQAGATHHSQHPVEADTAQYAAGTMHTSHLLTIHITFLNSGHLKQ